MQTTKASQIVVSVFAVAVCSFLVLLKSSQESIWLHKLQTVNSFSRRPIQETIQNHTSADNDAAKQPMRQSSNPIANFLLAGTQKAGTTALASYLFRRRDTCGPIPRPGLSYTGKEAHFFDEDAMMNKGLRHYESLFQKCVRNSIRIIMDATPKYMLHPENVRKIYEEHGTADTVKIMFTLREPVSREISWYKHLAHEATKRKPAPWSRVVWNETSGGVISFEKFVENTVLPSFQTKSEAARGLYAHWLRKWFEVFDRSQILILSYDTFRRNETDILMRVHDFLELPDSVKRTTPKSNVKAGPKNLSIPCSVQTRLAAEIEPYNQELYQLLRDHPGRPSAEPNVFPEFRFQCQE